VLASVVSQLHGALRVFGRLVGRAVGGALGAALRVVEGAVLIRSLVGARCLRGARLVGCLCSLRAVLGAIARSAAWLSSAASRVYGCFAGLLGTLQSTARFFGCLGALVNWCSSLLSGLGAVVRGLDGSLGVVSAAVSGQLGAWLAGARSAVRAVQALVGLLGSLGASSASARWCTGFGGFGFIVRLVSGLVGSLSQWGASSVCCLGACVGAVVGSLRSFSGLLSGWASAVFHGLGVVPAVRAVYGVVASLGSLLAGLGQALRSLSSRAACFFGSYASLDGWLGFIGSRASAVVAALLGSCGSSGCLVSGLVGSLSSLCRSLRSSAWSLAGSVRAALRSLGSLRSLCSLGRFLAGLRVLSAAFDSASDSALGVMAGMAKQCRLM
jgi:hypothetical protein